MEETTIAKNLRKYYIDSVVGVWKSEETGEQYQKRIRKQWKKRQKKLNW